MIHLDLNDLINKVDSKYTLVVEVAKRARSLVAGEKPLVETDSDKPVTIAIQEVRENLIKYKRTKEGIK